MGKVFGFFQHGINNWGPYGAFGQEKLLIKTMPNALAPGVVDVQYDAIKLEAMGGVGDLTWSKISGDLPPGLILVGVG